MVKEKKPLLSEEFLCELAEEINELYGGPNYEKNAEIVNNNEKISPINIE
ncbi:bacitracin ABC transporter ATP-binding protein [Niallia oryzisoli]|uniref:Bacitracin ABC transporter ATP-binding protein n=1 Tax=Niallia oryzisoli TaxID=1737571 RepID=A0ABZ2CB70_9BACI